MGLDFPGALAQATSHILDGELAEALDVLEAYAQPDAEDRRASAGLQETTLARVQALRRALEAGMLTEDVMAEAGTLVVIVRQQPVDFAADWNALVHDFDLELLRRRNEARRRFFMSA